MPHIRLATSSPATAPTTPLTLALIDRLARRASSHGADLLLLPEAFIGGYPRGADFGCKIGSRLPSGRDAFLDYFANAADLGDTVGDSGAGAGAAWINKTLPAQFPDPESKGYTRGDGSREELERIAAQTGVFLVVGLIEKAGGSLYCAVVYVCPHSGMLGKRRKVMPTATERLIWSQGSPATLKAVSTVIKGVRLNLAAAICWESYMPLLRQALYAQNVNLYLAPTADGRDTWLPLMRTVACEGRCFVVSSNMAVRPPVSSTEAAVEDAEVRDAEVYPARARRNSCLTEDGNEIALPADGGTTAAKSTTSTATSPSRRRRKSVIVEDGNEIVLSCDAEDNNANTTNGASTTTTNGTTAKKQQQPALKGEDWISRGGSCIVGPFGDVLAGPQWEDDEGIIYSDVDFEDCIRGRLDIDTAGSYSRNDSFKFSVEGLDLDPLPY